MWLGNDPWFHFRTGIPPTFSFLYQGRLAVNRKSRRFWKKVEKNEIRTGESCLGLGGKGRWRKVFTDNSHTWDCLLDASQNKVRTSSDWIWDKFDRSSTCVYFSFQSQFPISASWVVEKKMTWKQTIFSLTAVTLPKIRIVLHSMNKPQAAQAPAVRWSSCAITVMAEL